MIRLLVGLGAGFGLWLVYLGGAGHAVLRRSDATSTARVGRIATLTDQLLLRTALAAAGLLAALLLSHWLILGLTCAGVGWYAPSGFRQRGAHDREMAVVEGIATWTEQIRDTLAAANGLEHALAATAPLAPAAIAEHVERLGVRIDYERLSDALRRFADDVRHPMADFVVAALIIAAEKEARDLGSLLTHLSESARGEAQMRSRVWVGRARNRSAVRIIVSVVISFVVGLLIFNRAYLRPYDTVTGQVVLGIVLAVFGCAFLMMQRMGRIALPQRFIARRVQPELSRPDLQVVS